MEESKPSSTNEEYQQHYYRTSMYDRIGYAWGVDNVAYSKISYQQEILFTCIPILEKYIKVVVAFQPRHGGKAYELLSNDVEKWLDTLLTLVLSVLLGRTGYQDPFGPQKVRLLRRYLLASISNIKLLPWLDGRPSQVEKANIIPQ